MIHYDAYSLLSNALRGIEAVRKSGPLFTNRVFTVVQQKPTPVGTKKDWRQTLDNDDIWGVVLGPSQNDDATWELLEKSIQADDVASAERLYRHISWCAQQSNPSFSSFSGVSTWQTQSLDQCTYEDATHVARFLLENIKKDAPQIFPRAVKVFLGAKWHEQVPWLMQLAPSPLAGSSGVICPATESFCDVMRQNMPWDKRLDILEEWSKKGVDLNQPLRGSSVAHLLLIGAHSAPSAAQAKRLLDMGVNPYATFPRSSDARPPDPITVLQVLERGSTPERLELAKVLNAVLLQKSIKESLQEGAPSLRRKL